MVGDGTWLNLGEVMRRYRAAGLADGESTIRRAIDDGELGDVSATPGGHRRVRAQKVDAYIQKRLGRGDRPDVQ